MHDIDRLGLLRKAFNDLDDESLGEIGKVARVTAYPPNTVLCYEGDSGDKFYLIHEGQIEITKKFTATEERVMRTLKGGDYFGEIALLEDTPRTATIRTIAPTVVLEIDRSDFEAALRDNPRLSLTFLRTISKRMRINDARAIEEIRQQKEELEIAYTELQQQEKQRSEFLNTLAHELRTPLTTTSGYLQLLRAGFLQGEAMVNAIDRIDNSFKRVISLINDLLFVQQQILVEFSLVDVDLLEILDGVYNELEERGKNVGIAIRMRANTPVPIIPGDPAGLSRAFRHLLDNAIKFSPGQKEVMVDVTSKRKEIEINFVDYGVGIPADFMPRIFKQFERMEVFQGHLFDGVGLGLPIAKQIIERHGGSITVKSQVNKGTTFTVRLPLER